ncbi:MAG: response regulator transcription factor [Acidobacteriota bacterium]|nr:MAG: response regulator transcription factor [Acidobacteriota bacterium]
MKRDLILVVEDEIDIAEMVTYNLERWGYAVQVCSTGEEGLQVASSGPSLILLDLGLPGISGAEVCRRLKGKQATQEIPILVLTARGHETEVAACLDLGADGYLAKPFGLKELASRIRTMLPDDPAGRT